MMPNPNPSLIPASTLGSALYNGGELLKYLTEAIVPLRFAADRKGRLGSACKGIVSALDGCGGKTLQERWSNFEQIVWPKWMAGKDRPACRWRWGTRVIVITRVVLPSWEWISNL